MRVRIVKCKHRSYWYSNAIGHEYKVEEIIKSTHWGYGKAYSVVGTDGLIQKEDCVVIEDSDVRLYESGAKRDSNKDKPRPDLISPYFTERLGKHLRIGAEHYGERNWEKGMPLANYIESLERHLIALKKEQFFGQGSTGEDHASAIAFNIMAFIHSEEISK